VVLPWLGRRALPHPQRDNRRTTQTTTLAVMLLLDVQLTHTKTRSQTAAEEPREVLFGDSPPAY